MRDIFESHYQNNFWGDSESVSGPGSNMHATTTIRRKLPTVFIHLGIRSLLDIPCGDFQWMSKLKTSHIDYSGADIVPALIAANNKRYNTDRFTVLDVTRDQLPKVDLILCRDLLVHFSHRDINRALKNFRASGSTWLLATTFPGASIQDIETGQWRPIDLTRLRFGLGSTKLLLPETDADKLFGKSLGLWKLN